MRAVRVPAPGEVTVENVEAPGGDGVRVRMRSASICGSDLHLVGWGLPVTLGHEFAGVLDDGTPVTIEPHVPCGACDRCLGGEVQQCRTLLRRVYGVALDGGLADEVVVDPGCVVPLPTQVDVRDAALVEPLAVAVHGLNRARVEAGQRLLVIGGGSIGLTTVATAVYRGVEVDLAARHAHQVAAGDALGAGTAVADEYDLVVDAAGTQSSLDLAVERLRPGGVLVALGTWWSPVELGTSIAMKEITLVPAAFYGHHHGRREFEEAVEVLAVRGDIADLIVTHRYGLDDAAEAFRVAADRAAGTIKVVLHP